MAQRIRRTVGILYRWVQRRGRAERGEYRWAQEIFRAEREEKIGHREYL